ncbi:UDP-N-acetylglucosamine 2-epimerase [Robbsia andropogonis]|uniref:UDP-N-acetylglucosamine 2-epimerase (non-hydrolyzing) n=1 Tax=Robbsia andropogonis TaxID=28092 RepID=A0A0F5K4E5_9BURK|nr:UDP-N-acetylglucosamine 2-epimerase (non-hydrolyzing) [Robbsia andropogonis]KKB64407.1 UDP-N-acetylglucosamine 2-epimerase [Robbsia andropogonis]
MTTRILSIFGTRPEAIKMAPLVHRLRQEPDIESIVCVTGQHRAMLDQVLSIFEITPTIDLSVMTTDQSLNALAGTMLAALDDVLVRYRPDRVLVHGDTTTATTAAMAAFHRQIPVAHVEAGLRTGNLASPWPEEMNRRVVDVISDLMFAPTPSARDKLEAESLNGRIVVTGNTVIDALRMIGKKLESDTALRARLDAALPALDPSLPVVLVTGHRRENFGDGFDQICGALHDLAQTRRIQIVYPVHLNPNVQEPVRAMLSDAPNVHLIAPLDYLAFVRLMQRAALILTDSGGIQEEAPSLGKPVLVMRDVTERPEAVDAGIVRLVGTNRKAIRNGVLSCLERMAMADPDATSASFDINPYGDGHACERIAAVLAGRDVREFVPVPMTAQSNVAPLFRAIA